MVYLKADGSYELGRVAKDAFDVAGVKKMLVKIGVNDLVHPYCSDLRDYYNNSSVRPGGYTASVQQIIGGYEYLLEQAHSRGIEVYFFDITPFYAAEILLRPMPQTRS